MWRVACKPVSLSAVIEMWDFFGWLLAAWDSFRTQAAVSENRKYRWVGFAILFSVFVYFYPNALGHPDNYIPPNPMSTPFRDTALCANVMLWPCGFSHG